MRPGIKGRGRLRWRTQDVHHKRHYVFKKPVLEFFLTYRPLGTIIGTKTKHKFHKLLIMALHALCRGKWLAENKHRGRDWGCCERLSMRSCSCAECQCDQMPHRGRLGRQHLGRLTSIALSRGTHKKHFISMPKESRDGRALHERLHGLEPHPEFVPLGDKGSGEADSTDPMNRMNQRYSFGEWLGVRKHSAEP